ncbi:MAG: hypothetical protein ACLFUB_06280 [Cyclobacteriaceae bacterium]
MVAFILYSTLKAFDWLMMFFIYFDNLRYLKKSLKMEASYDR